MNRTRTAFHHVRTSRNLSNEYENCHREVQFLELPVLLCTLEISLMCQSVHDVYCFCYQDDLRQNIYYETHNRTKNKYHLPHARPNITTLISVASKKNRTVTHNILSAVLPIGVAALTVIDTIHRMTLMIILPITRQ